MMLKRRGTCLKSICCPKACISGFGDKIRSVYLILPPPLILWNVHSSQGLKQGKWRQIHLSPKAYESCKACIVSCGFFSSWLCLHRNCLFSKEEPKGRLVTSCRSQNHGSGEVMVSLSFPKSSFFFFLNGYLSICLSALDPPAYLLQRSGPHYFLYWPDKPFPSIHAPSNFNQCSHIKRVYP